MRKAILASVILGSMLSVAQAADVKLGGVVGVREDSDKVGVTSTNRERLTAQLNFTSDVDDKTKVAIALTTGTTKSLWNDMGDLSAPKTTALRLAYVEYAAAPFAKVTLGKMERPWASNALFFDNDIKPEGAAVALHHDATGLFANIAKVKLAQLAGKDSEVSSAQVGLSKAIADLNVGVYGGAINQQVQQSGVIVCVVPASVPALPVCPLERRNLKQLGASAKKEVAGIPVRAFYEQVKNDSVAKLNKATAYGVTFGKAAAAGTWELGYIHQKSETNALSTVWTDSDFADANAVAKGYGIRGAYAVTNNWKVRGTYYTADVGAVKPVAYKRGLVDLVYAF